MPDFRLWSPESPNLHTVAVDGCTARFGVREIRVDGTRLLLNGKPLFLKGANRHESHPDQGAATSEELMLRDIDVLDRIGGGDGFTGGLLYGVLKGWDGGKCAQFGWASGVMAASSLNDYAEPADEKQVWDVYAGNARVQR